MREFEKAYEMITVWANIYRIRGTTNYSILAHRTADLAEQRRDVRNDDLIYMATQSIELPGDVCMRCGADIEGDACPCWTHPTKAA